MARSPLMRVLQRIARDALVREQGPPSPSRRDFLRRSGALAIAGAIPAWAPVSRRVGKGPASSSSARALPVSRPPTNSTKPACVRCCTKARRASAGAAGASVAPSSTRKSRNAAVSSSTRRTRTSARSPGSSGCRSTTCSKPSPRAAKRSLFLTAARTRPPMSTATSRSCCRGSPSTSRRLARTCRRFASPHRRSASSTACRRRSGLQRGFPAARSRDWGSSSSTHTAKNWAAIPTRSAP